MEVAGAVENWPTRVGDGSRLAPAHAVRAGSVAERPRTAGSDGHAELPRSEELAARHDAALAVGRRATSPVRPWSLSPEALSAAPVVLPSPNGSAIAAAVLGVPLVAACLRNPSAVSAWLTQHGWGTADRPIAITPAGEQWPGRDVVRPAIEDWVGAGMVVAALVDAGAGPLSAEAMAAKALYDGIADVPGLYSNARQAVIWPTWGSATMSRLPQKWTPPLRFRCSPRACSSTVPPLRASSTVPNRHRTDPSPTSAALCCPPSSCVAARQAADSRRVSRSRPN